MSFHNPDKSKWNSSHHRTHKLISSLNDVIRDKEKELEVIKEDYKKTIDKIRKNIKALEDNCHHIDDGGPFVASCSVCGWTDFYDGG